MKKGGKNCARPWFDLSVLEPPADDR